MQKHPVTVQEMDRVAKQIGLTTGYNDAAMKKVVLINRLGFSVTMKTYEAELRHTLTVEQERQAAEIAADAEWLDTPMTDLEIDLMAARNMFDIAEQVGQEQKDFAEFEAEVKYAMLDAADLQATQDNARL